MHDDEIEVDEILVHGLLMSQMPDLAHLPLVIVEPWGTDNAIGAWAPTSLCVCPASIGRQGRLNSKRGGCSGWLPNYRSPFPSRSP